MANTILTPSVVGREALMILENNLVAASLFHRGHTEEFTGAKRGDTVSIRGPASFSAQEYSSSITVQNATESSTALTLEKHFDVSFAVTSKEWTLSLEDFNAQLLAPAVAAIAQGIDAYGLGKYTEVYNEVGTAGDPPDSLADLLAVDQKLNELKVPVDGRFAIVNPQAKTDILGVSNIINAEQRGDGGQALKNASMGNFLGLDWYMSQNIPTHTLGTLTNGSAMAALVNNASVAVGNLTVPVDASSLSGTVVVGDTFTVAGDTQQYAVTAAATASGNAIAAMAFFPAAKVAWADNAAVTFNTDGVATDTYIPNLAGHRNAMTMAMVPLALPRGAANAAYIGDRGLGLRIVFDYDNNAKQDVISIDVLCGAKVQDGELITRVLG